MTGVAGSSREGLYHRLNVILVHVPLSPDQRDEIAALAQHFAAAAAAELGIFLNNPGIALSSS